MLVMLTVIRAVLVGEDVESQRFEDVDGDKDIVRDLRRRSAERRAGKEFGGAGGGGVKTVVVMWVDG